MPKSALNSGGERKSKVKGHVTWDEEQLAEHDKTRGQKMKIDEPKTPFVTQEEFDRLCAEDPDYVKEFGIQVGKDEDMIGSDKASIDEDNSNKSMEGDLSMAQQNMKINMNINFKDNGLNSDDEAMSPEPSGD